ncbi:MAG TPA: substrate-binding domain-containing protein [Candidatus Omnitrophota bacterium]|nr:substrate-binding domain-containing protein [Candidatus Omnitrophota bacterium]
MPPEWVARPIKRPPGADLALAIDQQLYPALLPLVQRFARDNGIRVALQEGTCGVAAGALADKSADITGMCCPPGPLDRMPGVRYHTIGIAAIALIVHPSNGVADVSLDQARRMFGGEVRSWSDLPVSGFKPAPAGEVRAVTRLHCKPRPGHWRLLLDNENLFAADALDVPAIRDMIAHVSASPAAIGYETLWHVADNAKVGQVKTLRLDGVLPGDGTALAQGRYPLYRVMNVTTWGGAGSAPMAGKLVAYLLEHAADIDPVYGIVPAVALRRNGWQFAGDELVGQPK